MRITLELTHREADELMREADPDRWYARSAESTACISRELNGARQKIRDAILKGPANDEEDIRLRAQLEAYERAGREDASAHGEVKMLREFIADVRRGIRTLDEYEALCDPVRL